MSELDAQIRAAEQRLIEREQQLSQRAALLGVKVRQGLRPARFAAPALGAAAAGAALWWTLRRARRAPMVTLLAGWALEAGLPLLRQRFAAREPGPAARR
jgi:hypothetical protein